jgi:flagellar biosynthetic protein FlhB
VAGDKSQRTEKATPKRKKDARKKGQVAKSPELVAWSTLLLASVLVQTTIKLGAENLRTLFSEVSASITDPTPQRAVSLLGEGLMDVLVIIAPLALGFAALAIVGNLAQVGIYASFSRLKPKFNRMNPFKGLKNMLSTRSLWESVKAILRFLILGAIAWPVLSSAGHTLAGGANLTMAVSTTGGAAIKLVRNTAAAGLALAAVDYIVQRRRVNAELRMTRREIKEELRQSEGDPFVKQAIRSRQMRIGRNRMIALVADADVVLVNPTHFSVALRYQAAQGAPQVVAKGAGVLAARIREAAEEHGVAVVQDPPLARALYRMCDVGAFIPPEVYAAVARILAFVFGLRARGVRPLPGTRLMAPGGESRGLPTRKPPKPRRTPVPKALAPAS